jgi:drug/metabolite transporter (DMT)-like permease
VALSSPRVKADLMLLATAVIWGSGFVAQRSVVDDLGPMSFTGVRFFLGWLCIQPLVRKIPKSQNRDQRSFNLSLVLGLILLTGSVLQQFGIQYTTASKAGFLTSIYVVLTPILASFWSHKIAAKTWTGAIIVLLGMYLMSVQGITINKGDLLVISGACMWAGQILLLDYLAKKVHPLLLASRQFLLVAVVATAYGACFENWNAASWLNAAPEVLFSGIFAIGIAFSLQAVAQVNAPPSDAAIIMSAEAVFAAVFGYLILDEELSARELMGCSLVLLGVIVSQLRWRRKLIKL